MSPYFLTLYPINSPSVKFLKEVKKKSYHPLCFKWLKSTWLRRSFHTDYFLFQPPIHTQPVALVRRLPVLVFRVTVREGDLEKQQDSDVTAEMLDRGQVGICIWFSPLPEEQCSAVRTAVIQHGVRACERQSWTVLNWAVQDQSPDSRSCTGFRPRWKNLERIWWCFDWRKRPMVGFFFFFFLLWVCLNRCTFDLLLPELFVPQSRGNFY